MPRYVLKRASNTALDAGRIQALDGLDVIDAIGEVGLLLEADPSALERHRAVLDGWTIAPEFSHALPGLPDPREPTDEA